jgi:multidrug efflux pump subunit AcrB
MTSIIRAAIRNRQVVYVLTAAAVIVGLHALVAMPRREDPKITIRQGLVLAMYPALRPSRSRPRSLERSSRCCSVMPR